MSLSGLPYACRDIAVIGARPVLVLTQMDCFSV